MATMFRDVFKGKFIFDVEMRLQFARLALEAFESLISKTVMLKKQGFLVARRWRLRNFVISMLTAHSS